MTEQYYIEYFTAMAQSAKAISHIPGTHEAFFVIEDLDNIQEVQDAIRKKLKYPAMLLEMFEDDLDDNNTDNNLELLHGAFAIIIKVDQGKSLDRRAARQEARRIGKLIVFKMKRDSINGELAGNNIIFKLRSKGLPVGPVGENSYGWRYTFSWQTNVITATNPADWNT